VKSREGVIGEAADANGAMVEISAADESTSAKPKIAAGKPLRSKQ
jgi:hypothetical protein